jgi:SAM-dependent methyltransferase
MTDIVKTATDSTEPSDVAEYSRVEYWDQRYTHEERYDWFPSVYAECVERLLDECAAVLERKRATDSAATTLRVLHLGCGNSRLCHDLALGAQKRFGSVDVLRQYAMDYSATCIERMSKGDQPVGTMVWCVADCRDLRSMAQHPVVAQHVAVEKGASDLSRWFDVVIDKGTMDALQADKESDTLDEDLDAMLTEASRVLAPGGAFLQVTWEAPYFRKHWTLRPEYVWGADAECLRVVPLGLDEETRDSLYRVFVFTAPA